jgi:hypothetical protein
VSQQRQEEEQPRGARAERTPRLEVQLATIGDLRGLGDRSVTFIASPAGSSAAVGEKKGGVAPRRRSARNRLIIDRIAESL